MIEADFQREYGMDLVAELPKLSWRKFLVLLRGFSPNSVFVITNSSSDTDKGGKKMITDPKEAEKALERYFG